MILLLELLWSVHRIPRVSRRAADALLASSQPARPGIRELQGSGSPSTRKKASEGECWRRWNRVVTVCLCRKPAQEADQDHGESLARLCELSWRRRLVSRAPDDALIPIIVLPVSRTTHRTDARRLSRMVVPAVQHIPLPRLRRLPGRTQEGGSLTSASLYFRM